MRLKKFRFILIMLLILAAMILAVNTAGLIQPSRSDIIGMNSLWWDPYELTVHMDMIDDDFVMYYDTVIKGQSVMATWNGEATVYYLNAYFKQSCETLRYENTCCKAWRGEWVKADYESLLNQIALWQEDLAAGKGSFRKEPVLLSDYSERLAEHYSGKCYRMELTEVPLDWKMLCDVALDVSFGGEERWQHVPVADVTFFYGTDDLLLKAVTISFMDDKSWLDYSVLISPLEENLNVDLTGYEIREGYLDEEWDILIPNAEK